MGGEQLLLDQGQNPKEVLTGLFGPNLLNFQTIEQLQDKGFFISTVGKETCLIWPGYEADAAALAEILFGKNEVGLEDSTVNSFHLGTMSDSEFYTRLYGSDDEFAIDQIPQNAPILWLLTRERSIFSSIDNSVTPAGCELTPLQHIAGVSRRLQTDFLLSTESNVKATSRLAAIMHDWAKVIDPMNGDHATVSAQMAKTMLVYISSSPALAGDTQVYVTPELIQNVVSVIGLHHLAGNTSRHWRNAAHNLNHRLIQEKWQEVVTAADNWLAAQVITSLAKEISWSVTTPRTHDIYEALSHLRPVYQQIQSLKNTVVSLQKTLAITGYGLLATTIDSVNNTALFNAMQVITDNLDRLLAFYLFSIADLKTSDKDPKDINLFLQELDSMVLAMLHSIGYVSSQQEITFSVEETE